MAKRPLARRKRTSPSRTRGRAPARTASPRTSGRPALLIVLATDLAHFEKSVTVLIDMGLAATVIQTRPLSSVLREEIPMFAGLASLLPRMPESRLLISITTTKQADRALAMLSSESGDSRDGIFVATMPLRGFFGPLGKG